MAEEGKRIVSDSSSDEGSQEPERGARPQEISDHDLIRAAQRGEELGFEQLVKRHQDRAIRVAWGLVPNREDACDLAQEAFLRVFRNLDRFDFQHEFTTWLFRIVTNLAIDHLRKRRPQRSTTVQGEEGEMELELTDADAEQPFEPMVREETGELVRACIDRLAPHFRTVLILRELEGLPCTEIAEIVGATHVTVRWRLHRGRKLFQDEWERMERSGGLRAALERGAAEGQKDASSGEKAANNDGEGGV
ncbi:MAG TPA: sigma-70 family RNA polymerase sigma factor [Planctomycetes bacterium]|nr:sigma-70 family RNA polymerase sigma factor [Planctomycetota bacterium]